MTSPGKPLPAAVADSLVGVLSALDGTAPSVSQRTGESADSTATPPAPGPRYRHAPTLPANQELVLSEAIDRNGKQYFFGFVGTQKYFMTRDPSRSSTWRLYSQSLRPSPDASTLAEPERGRHGGQIVRAVPVTQGFVSALAPARLRAGRGP